MKSLEKKPMKGGTPAIENKSIGVNVREKELKLKPLNEWRVLNLVVTTLNKVQNSVIKDVL